MGIEDKVVVMWVAGGRQEADGEGGAQRWGKWVSRIKWWSCGWTFDEWRQTDRGKYRVCYSGSPRLPLRYDTTQYTNTQTASEQVKY